MKRREFMQSAGVLSLSIGLPGLRRRPVAQEASGFEAEYWDIAIQLVESIETLYEGNPSDLAQEFGARLLESARAVLAGARDGAVAAFENARSLGADLWGELDRLAAVHGLELFPEYRLETMEWLRSALDEWGENGELPTFRVSEGSVRCFFSGLPEQEPCIDAPVSAIRRCAVTSLVGLVAGPNGYLTVFGLCMRKRLPGLAVRLAVDCLAPVAIECFADSAGGE